MDLKGISSRVVVAVILIIIVVAGVGIWLMYPREQKTEKGEPIKLAVITNLSGSYGSEGLRGRIITTSLTTELNAKGGVYLEKTNTYHPLEVHFYDGESTVQKFTEFVSKVLTEKQVHVIWMQAAPPQFSTPAKIMIEKMGGIPTINTSPYNGVEKQVMASIPEGRYVWNWIFSFNNTETFRRAWPSILGKYKDKTNGVIGILYLDDIVGHDNVKVVPPELEKIGFTIFNPGFVTPGTTDFTPVITRFKEQSVEIVLVHITPVEWVPFRRQCATLGFHPKIIGTARCMELYIAEALGKALAEGVMVEVRWWHNYPFKGNDWFKVEWPRIAGDMYLSFSEGYILGAFQVLIEAIRIAGAPDRDAINNAFPKVDIETPTGPVKFDSRHYSMQIGTVGQFVMTSEGKWDINIIWAPEGSGIVTSPIIFPLPG